MVDQTTYREQSHIYLTQAREEFARDDLRQASEKAWGAASQIIKGAAEQYGWQHISHRHLLEAASLLREQTGDQDLSLLFRSAQALHTHFYEGNLNPDEVAECVDDTARFIDKVEALLSAR
jgi:hypothetical protein